MRPNLSEAELSSIYNEDYLSYALLPLISSGLVESKFLCIEDLYPYLNGDSDIWSANIDNPYVHSYINSKRDLGISVLQEGMYFPFYVIQVPGTNKYLVFEGRHRIDSLRFLVKDGVINPKTKFLCLIAPSVFYRSHGYYSKVELPEPVQYRSLCNIRGIYDYATNIEVGTKVTDHAQQYTTSRALDIITTVERYQYTLSKWFYYYDIPKSRIINDEEEFNKWITNSMNK